MTSAPVMRDGPLRIGLQLSNPPNVPLPEDIWQDLEFLAPTLLKIDAEQFPDDLARIVELGIVRDWIVEVKLELMSLIGPDEFVDKVIGNLRDGLRAVWASDYDSVTIELQAKPDVPVSEGWFNWPNGEKFGEWWLSVVYRLRESLPPANYMFPRLGATEQTRFLINAEEAIWQADSLGTSVDISMIAFSPEVIDSLLGDFKRFEKPLWITEAFANPELGNLADNLLLMSTAARTIEEQLPIVHGIIFAPFFTHGETDRQMMWARRANLPELREFLHGDFSGTVTKSSEVATASDGEVASGYVWQGATEALEGDTFQLTSQATVRTGPNPQSSLMGTLPAGTILQMIGEPAGSYLPINVDQADFLPPEQAVQEIVEGWVWGGALELREDRPAVSVSVGANVRRGPNTKADIIGVLRRGARVEVIGDEDNEFLPVRVNPDDLVVQNEATLVGSAERMDQASAQQSLLDQLDLSLPDLEAPGEQISQQARQQVSSEQLPDIQQKGVEDSESLGLSELQPYGTSVQPGSAVEAEGKGEWIFTAVDEWPETVWPGEVVAMTFSLANNTSTEIPGGQLWIREYIQNVSIEAERESVGEGIEFPGAIPAGKSLETSALFLMPRASATYRWQFFLETGQLSAPNPMSGLTMHATVLDDEAVSGEIRTFPTLTTSGKQMMISRAGSAVANLSLEDPLRRQLLHDVLIPAVTADDWRVVRDSLEQLQQVDQDGVDESLIEDLQRAVSVADRAREVEAVLQRRMRREIREWTRTWLTPLLSELTDSRPDTAVSTAARVAEPTPLPLVDPPSRSASVTPTVTASAAAVQPVQITINKTLAASEPAGGQDRLTLTVTQETVMARLQLDGNEDNFASPFKLDEQALNRLVQEPDQYGEALFAAILHGDPMPGADKLTATMEALERLQTDSMDYVVELFIDPSLHSSFDAADFALHSLWWERLKQPHDVGNPKAPLATNNRNPFYRRLTGPIKPAIDADPLKVLVVICNPRELGKDVYVALENLSPVDVAQEREILEDALAPLQASGVGEFTILGGPENSASLSALTTALQDGYHVVHIVAHGIYYNEKFSLVMEDDRGDAAFVSPGDFQQLLATNDAVRLVTLTVCQSAIDNSGSSFRGLGPRLVQLGVPAVIAMQDLILVEAAQIFHQHFYNHLARTGRVDKALAAARFHLYQEERLPGQWAIPVLYLGSGNGQLFQPEGDAPAKLPELETARAKSYDELAGEGDPTLSKATQQLRSQANQLGLAPATIAAIQAVMAPGMTGRPAGPETNLAVPQDGGKLSSEITAPVKISAAELKAYVAAETPLILDDGLFPQLAGALSAGKHIVLTGPPGTGKTSLALALAKLAQAKQMNRGVTLTTATPDWTTFDTIGGYVPSRSQTLQFKPGMFLETIREGRWLVIDEMNRAEIDKAFGELFTVLSGQRVDLPYEVGKDRVRILPPAGNSPADWWPANRDRFDYVRHPNWRIIGTMNVFDRSFLFAMSFAFMRRFAFIGVAVPEPGSYGNLRKSWLGDRLALAAGTPELDAVNQRLDAIFDQNGALMTRRALGPAIALDMIRYLSERGSPWSGAIAEAMMLYVVPQLDGLEPTAIFAIYRQLKQLFNVQEQRLLLPRIEELYPHIQASDWQEEDGVN